MISAISYSQISPGDLSQPHADLEGMSKCTQCHELGNKVADKKCLECHDEIKTLLTNRRGYHANAKVKNKSCVACHNEHHGRKFKMIRFDEDNFNHDLAGYTLKGKHEVVDCKKCHTPDYIANKDIKKRKNTFLGLEKKCLSCHDDYHQKTLSNKCTNCHSMETEFKETPNFDHDKTDYALQGKHIEVDCKKCHEVTTRNGKEFQQFSDIRFNDCKTCHDDPHNQQLTGKCNQCHTEKSFSTFIGRNRFNHTSSGFTLKGKHKKINCFSCHAKTGNPKLVFQDKQKVSENRCIACHKDEHEGKYGTNCAKCHRESSFLSLRKMDFFNHSVTDYPLQGQHLEVDCKQCHKKRFSTPINFTTCNSCHKDYHQGDFTKQNGTSPDCVKCHSLEKGFDYSLYTLEQHQTTTFPLEGAHNATPCFACHVDEKEERWKFSELGTSCTECHQDFHQGYISKKYYPTKKCETCHVNDSWRSVTFNHSLTEWPLTGKHKSVDCRNCHFEISGKNKLTTQKFKGLQTKCTECHDNKHGDTFAINGITDCKRCHVTNSWFPKKFNHNNTAFPLKGQHANVECKECHTAKTVNGKATIVYKIKRFQCIDCHQ